MNWQQLRGIYQTPAEAVKAHRTLSELTSYAFALRMSRGNVRDLKDFTQDVVEALNDYQGLHRAHKSEQQDTQGE